MTRPVALILTVLTGFSGLVYEVTWEKYLATLLGSHSEATVAVLGIFLGGLSLGYLLFGKLAKQLAERARRTGKPSHLLVTYGALEVGIAIERPGEMVRLPFAWDDPGWEARAYTPEHTAVGRDGKPVRD